MTLVGFLVLMGWLPSTLFLYLHGRTQWRRSWAGQAVFVMALVVSIVMTLALVRRTFGVLLPEWVSGVAYLLVLIALWWKTITILRYEYGDRVPLFGKPAEYKENAR